MVSLGRFEQSSQNSDIFHNNLTAIHIEKALVNATHAEVWKMRTLPRITICKVRIGRIKEGLRDLSHRGHILLIASIPLRAIDQINGDAQSGRPKNLRWSGPRRPSVHRLHQSGRRRRNGFRVEP